MQKYIPSVKLTWQAGNLPFLFFNGKYISSNGGFSIVSLPEDNSLGVFKTACVKLTQKSATNNFS